MVFGYSSSFIESSQHNGFDMERNRAYISTINMGVSQIQTSDNALRCIDHEYENTI